VRPFFASPSFESSKLRGKWRKKIDKKLRDEMKIKYIKVKIMLNLETRCYLKGNVYSVAGGNQRELARAKNLKKTVKKAASEQDSNKGLSLEQRKAR